MRRAAFYRALRQLLCWIACIYLNAFAPEYFVSRLVEMAIVSPDLIVFSSLVEHRRVLSSCIHLVALRTCALKSSTLLLDSSRFLCSFNPSRTVHQKNTYATISYPTPSCSNTRSRCLKGHDPLHALLCNMPATDLDPHPPSWIVFTDAPNGSPRTNSRANPHRHVAIGRIRPLFWSSISLSILLSSPCIRLRLWPYRDPCCPLQRGFNPSSFTRARASTPRAGHQTPFIL